MVELIQAENEPTEMEIRTPTVIDSLVRAETDVQIATAKQYPRSINRFKGRAVSLATHSEEVAASCSFSLKRGGKTIEGPGIRLAEIAALSWGNLRWGARVVGEDDEVVRAQGYAHDMETNVSFTAEVCRRITDRSGRRYNADMIAVTSNAACSIAARNAVLRLIPRAYVEEIRHIAKECAVGTAKTLSDRRGRALDWFREEGIDTKRVFDRLEVEGEEDIDLGKLSELQELRTALRDGVSDVDTLFPREESNGTKQEKILEKITHSNGKAGQKTD